MKMHDRRLIAGLTVLLLSLAAGAAEPAKALVKPATARPTSCAMVTGSMIRPRPEKNCESSPSPLRSFTADELQATGENDTAAALRKLYPGFR